MEKQHIFFLGVEYFVYRREIESAVRVINEEGVRKQREGVDPGRTREYFKGLLCKGVGE
jgi:hypothetical protein